MRRIYKTLRLAYETKLWVTCLASKCNDDLQEQIDEGLLDQIENEICSKYKTLQKGIAFSFKYHVTTGSVIDMAVEEAKDLSIAEWRELAVETEKAKNHIEDTELKDATPSMYLLPSTCSELENLQSKLKGDNKRVPKTAYIIKLAVYHLYKKTFC